MAGRWRRNPATGRPSVPRPVDPVGLLRAVYATRGATFPALRMGLWHFALERGQDTRPSRTRAKKPLWPGVGYGAWASRCLLADLNARDYFLFFPLVGLEPGGHDVEPPKDDTAQNTDKEEKTEKARHFGRPSPPAISRGKLTPLWLTSSQGVHTETTRFCMALIRNLKSKIASEKGLHPCPPEHMRVLPDIVA